jgi:succinyl-CoA synthetase alpha subunit
MAIFADKKTKVIVQGITGRDGAFHTRQMVKYGTRIVGGVTPGKGGTKLDDIPVFDSMQEAVKVTKANTSIIYVPPAFAIDAIYEAAEAGIELIVCITEGVPANDMMKVYHSLKHRGIRLIGPNCPGIISPGLTKVGIMPAQIHKKGNIGVVSRSGTLTYEVVYNLTLAGFGQSTCIGIGGDQIIGTNFIDCLENFENDPGTEAVVMIGEIGGSDEEMAAEFIGKKMKKPVIGFIAGRTAPPGKRMGHAGAIISGSSGLAGDKIAALNKVGVPVADIPSQLPILLKEKLEAAKKRKPKKKAAKKKATKKKAKKAAKKSKKVAKKAKKVVKKATRKAVKKKAAARTKKKTAKKRKTVRRK